MKRTFEHPKSPEGRKKPSESAWHNKRAQLLALVLLIPMPALAKDEVQSPTIEVEMVEEDRDAFLRRLDDAARTRSTETSWSHFTSPEGRSFSTNISIEGTEEANSVVADLREATLHALKGDTVEICHTHPVQSVEITGPVIEGQPLAIDVPSPTDIESFFYRLAFLTRSMDSDKDAASLAERYTNCVMTATGGYWTLSVVDLEQMEARVNAITQYQLESFQEVIDIVVEQEKSPEVLELFALLPPEQWKGESIINRIILFAYTVDTASPALSPELVRLLERIRGRKRPLELEPSFFQVQELIRSFFDTGRSASQSQQDIEAYLSYVREAFGIKIEWHQLPLDE